MWEYQICTKSKVFGLHTFCILFAYFCKNIYKRGLLLLVTKSSIEQRSNKEKEEFFGPNKKKNKKKGKKQKTKTLNIETLNMEECFVCLCVKAAC